MVAACQLFFIHEPEGTGEGFREGNASSGETLNKPFSEELQHVAAPGKPSSVFRLFSGREELGLPFGKVGFDGTA
jgi:hypothetical protein